MLSKGRLEKSYRYQVVEQLGQRSLLLVLSEEKRALLIYSCTAAINIKIAYFKAEFLNFGNFKCVDLKF